jgi:hypothetical protein
MWNHTIQHNSIWCANYHDWSIYPSSLCAAACVVRHLLTFLPFWRAAAAAFSLVGSRCRWWLLTLPGFLFRDRLDDEWPSPVGSAENSTADAVGITSFLFSLLWRGWVSDAEGRIWAPIVITSQLLESCVMISSKDQPGVTGSSLV